MPTKQDQQPAISISCNPKQIPAIWLSELMAKAPKACLREVLVRLVGALFRVRNRTINTKANLFHPRDLEIGGYGDFDLGSVSYQVADMPTVAELHRCKEDIYAHRFPVLLVPRLTLTKAYLLAQQAGIKQKVTVFALEDFLTHALLFQSLEQGCTIFSSWESIIVEYNRQIEITCVPLVNLV